MEDKPSKPIRKRRSSDSSDITEVINLDQDSDQETDATRKVKPKMSQEKGVNSDESVPSTSKSVITSSGRSNNPCEDGANSITSLLCSYIIEDLHPITILRDKGLRQLMRSLRPNCEFPTEDALLNEIDFIYGAEKANTLDILHNVQSISIGAEGWYSYTKNAYVTIRANFIDNNWEPQSYVLSTIKLNDPLNVDSLNERIARIVEHWDISKKIESIVYGLAPFTIKNSRQSLPQSDRFNCFGARIVCFAERLQLCIEHGLRSNAEIRALVDKCNRLVSHFHHDNAANIYLLKYQRYLNIVSEELIESNPDEINSIYSMLDRLVSQRKAIESVISDRDVSSEEVANELQISKDEWSQIEKLMATLKPFQLANVILFKGHNLQDVISVIKPLVDTLCKNFLTYDLTTDTRVIFSFKQCIRDRLLNYYQMYTSNAEVTESDYLDVATLLDPRYKNQDYLGKKKEAIRNLIRDKIFPKNKTTLTSQRSFNRSANALSFLFPSQSDAAAAACDEWSRYIAEPEINKNLSIYKWWKLNEHIYPVLSRVAKRHLSARVTAKSVCTPRNITIRRGCLTPQHIDKLIFLNDKKRK